MESFADITKNAVSAFAPGGGGSVLSGSVTITVPQTFPKGQFEHSETVSAVGVTAASIVSLSIANHADDDENSNDMLDIVSLVAVPSTDAFGVVAVFSQPTSGPIKLNYLAV